jgi:GABA(A) receptor-associated protein
MSTFKEKHNLEARFIESSRIIQKYPDRVPVIVENVPGNKSIPKLDKTKYLVPNDMTLGQFAFTIRRRVKLEPEKAMFLFVNNKMLPCSELMGKIYVDNAEDDMFLYMVLQGENTFGI